MECDILLVSKWAQKKNADIQNGRALLFYLWHLEPESDPFAKTKKNILACFDTIGIKVKLPCSLHYIEFRYHSDGNITVS
jgi:hypothetical protein